MAVRLVKDTPGTGARARSVVLIVSTHALLGALLGVLVELGGYSADFPEPHEATPDAMSRLRPAVVLVEAKHDAAREEDSYRRAAESGSALFLFGHVSERSDLDDLARQYGVRAFELPIDYADLEALLGAAAQRSAARRG